MWFRRWFRPERVRSEGLSSTNGRLTFELDHELAAQLRLAARTRAQSPERLAADLLARGLRGNRSGRAPRPPWRSSPRASRRWPG